MKNLLANDWFGRHLLDCQKMGKQLQSVYGQVLNDAALTHGFQSAAIFVVALPFAGGNAVFIRLRGYTSWSQITQIATTPFYHLLFDTLAKARKHFGATITVVTSLEFRDDDFIRPWCNTTRFNEVIQSQQSGLVFITKARVCAENWDEVPPTGDDPHSEVNGIKTFNICEALLNLNPNTTDNGLFNP
jgi:hypothetical protein